MTRIKRNTPCSYQRLGRENEPIGKPVTGLVMSHARGVVKIKTPEGKTVVAEPARVITY